jgi:MprA protease rhombosortase-interaction domain-containing protein
LPPTTIAPSLKFIAAGTAIYLLFYDVMLSGALAFAGALAYCRMKK